MAVWKPGLCLEELYIALCLSVDGLPGTDWFPSWDVGCFCAPVRGTRRLASLPFTGGEGKCFSESMSSRSAYISAQRSSRADFFI